MHRISEPKASFGDKLVVVVAVIILLFLIWKGL
jgi:hypothetical protein